MRDPSGESANSQTLRSGGEIASIVPVEASIAQAR